MDSMDDMDSMDKYGYDYGPDGKCVSPGREKPQRGKRTLGIMQKKHIAPEGATFCESSRTTAKSRNCLQSDFAIVSDGMASNKNVIYKCVKVSPHSGLNYSLGLSPGFARPLPGLLSPWAYTFRPSGP